MTVRLNALLSWATTGLVLAALAGCADGAAGPQADSGGTTSGSGSSSTRVGLANCATPDGGKVHFKVGDTILALLPNEIDETIPTGLKPPYTPELLKAEIERQTAQGGGCPGKPLDMLVLAMRAEGGDSLLQGTIGMLATDPQRLSRGYADVTAKLQANPPQTCKRLGGDLLACTGTETAGQTRSEVMYIITTDRSKKMNSGGPLAIRCAIQQAQVRGCNIVDQGRGNFIIDAILKQGDYSTASLENAWRTALNAVNSRTR